MALVPRAIKGKKGMHSGKDVPAAARVSDASEVRKLDDHAALVGAGGEGDGHRARPLMAGPGQGLARAGGTLQSVAKAKQFLTTFKRQERLSAVVDYVMSGSRFKLLVPRDNLKLTFALSGPALAPPPRHRLPPAGGRLQALLCGRTRAASAGGGGNHALACG